MVSGGRFMSIRGGAYNEKSIREHFNGKSSFDNLDIAILFYRTVGKLDECPRV